MLATFLATPLPAQTFGTAFTYQGLLNENGTPVNGTRDLTFRLFDAPSGGNQIGSAIALSGVAVTGGLVTVSLDFGAGAFDGDARWLEIQIDATVLAPRRGLTPTPYALYAAEAGNLSGTTAVEIELNNIRAWRVEAAMDSNGDLSPNFIAGASINSVASGAAGAVIAGGGDAEGANPDLPNIVTDDYGTVGGGSGNRAGDATGTTSDQTHATVGGGSSNTASAAGRDGGRRPGQHDNSRGH
jgi:hypothetical protein